MNKKIVSKTKMNVIAKKKKEKEDPNGFETDSFNTDYTEDEFSESDNDNNEFDLSDKDVKLDKDHTLINFDWSKYINYYEDLKQLNTKEKAWNHWINHGKKEKRVTFNIHEKKINEKEIEDNNKNIIFKKIYENYGTSYYGWENVINQFVFNLKKTRLCICSNSSIN
jgi:hypothetical protein